MVYEILFFVIELVLQVGMQWLYLSSMVHLVY